MKSRDFSTFLKEVYFFMGEESFGFIKRDMFDCVQGTVFKIQIYLYITGARNFLRYALGYLHTLYFIEWDIVCFEGEPFETAYNQIF